MQCPQCQRENPSDNAFCGGCGSNLTPACRQCGRENPPDHAFCGGCGARIESAGNASVPGALDTPTAARTPSHPRVSHTGGAAGAAALPISSCSGRYQVQRFLGEGSRKRVYLAHDSRLGREVAVAIIKSERLDAPGRARVRREAEAVGQLGDHPHIVTVYDVVEDEGQIQLVGQYLSGGDLEGHLRRAPDNRLEILAARIAAEARGGEILVSDLIRQLTESAGDVRFGAARETILKGISEPQRLQEIEWRLS